VYGHGQFGQALCDAGLVDQLNVCLIPVFVADGTSMFQPGGTQHEWVLTGTTHTDPSTVISTYAPRSP
jgi:dihydrofolate reductase